MKITRYREFDSMASSPGVRFFAAESDRFKTVRVRVFFTEPIRRETATLNALLALVVQDGCAACPTRRELARACEELYGASVGLSVSRFADVQTLAASAEFPADRYLPRGSRVMDGVLRLLNDLITRPVLRPDNLGLRDESVAQEKTQLGNELRALQDDRGGWASLLASRFVYEGTPAAIHEHGELEDLEAIDGRALLARHGELLSQARVYAFITGPVSTAAGLKALSRHLALPRGKRPATPAATRLKPRSRLRTAEAVHETEQAHIFLALAGGACYGEPGFAPTLYANGIFGGFSFSRLFRVVRETHGLAYAVHSDYHRARGCLMAHAAVDPKEADKAAKLIRFEFQRLRRHGPTVEEFEACRQSLIEARRAALDSPTARASDCVFQAVLGFRRTPEQQLRDISRVTPEQVREALAALSPHSEFRMAPR